MFKVCAKARSKVAKDSWSKSKKNIGDETSFFHFFSSIF
jgi:hypothetical protein